MRPKVLVVDDESGIRLTFDIFLSGEGCDVTTAVDYEAAMQRISETDFDVIFVDLILEGPTGMEILREARRKDPLCPVVMITGAPSDETDLEAASLDAFEYLPKPVVKETLLTVTRRALSYRSSSRSEREFRE
jgi:DNA-binding NtrC family response regulator